MIIKEIIKEGHSVKKDQTKKKQTKKSTTKNRMLQYKKIHLNMSSAHNTNTELCYHSTVLLQSPPYILRAPSTVSFGGKKIIFLRPWKAHIFAQL